MLIGCLMYAWHLHLLNLIDWIFRSWFELDEVETNRPMAHRFVMIYREERPPQHVLLLGNGRSQLSQDVGHRVPQLQQTSDESHLPQRNPSWFFQLHASSKIISNPNQMKAFEIILKHPKSLKIIQKSSKIIQNPLEIFKTISSLSNRWKSSKLVGNHNWIIIESFLNIQNHWK